MVSRRIDWLAWSQVPVVGDASSSIGSTRATYLWSIWLTRGITNCWGFHNADVIGAWSRVSAGGYRYLVGVAQHVALIEAWVSTVAWEYSRMDRLGWRWEPVVAPCHLKAWKLFLDLDLAIGYLAVSLRLGLGWLRICWQIEWFVLHPECHFLLDVGPSFLDKVFQIWLIIVLAKLNTKRRSGGFWNVGLPVCCFFSELTAALCHGLWAQLGPSLGWPLDQFLVFVFWRLRQLVSADSGGCDLLLRFLEHNRIIIDRQLLGCRLVIDHTFINSNLPTFCGWHKIRISDNSLTLLLDLLRCRLNLNTGQLGLLCVGPTFDFGHKVDVPSYSM